REGRRYDQRRRQWPESHPGNHDTEGKAGRRNDGHTRSRPDLRRSGRAGISRHADDRPRPHSRRDQEGNDTAADSSGRVDQGLRPSIRGHDRALDDGDVYRGRVSEPQSKTLVSKRRNTMKGLLIFLFALVMLVPAVAAYAHHSFAATYDESKTITLEGRMVQFSFRNPHSFVQVEVTDGTQKTRWAVEWAGTAQLNNT